MFEWFLRIVTVIVAFWLSHAYIVAISGNGLSPVSIETLKHDALRVWQVVQRGFDEFDWVILSPLAVGFIFVAALAFNLMRTAGR